MDLSDDRRVFLVHGREKVAVSLAPLERRALESPSLAKALSQGRHTRYPLPFSEAAAPGGGVVRRPVGTAPPPLKDVKKAQRTAMVLGVRQRGSKGDSRASKSSGFEGHSGDTQTPSWNWTDAQKTTFR